MKIKVLYFATLQDRAGVKEEMLDLEDGASVAGLKNWLAREKSALASALDSCLVSVNHEFAFDQEPLSDGDEVGLFPPVSGGQPAAQDILEVTEEAFNLDRLIRRMVEPTTGAACAFTGVVRARTEAGGAHETEYLEYEAYQPMAEAKLAQVAREIRERWPTIERVAIIQRIGQLEAGTPTVLIACTAAHRDSGVFEATRYGIDRLKEIVPIWKKEVGPDGAEWVEGSYLPSPSDRSEG